MKFLVLALKLALAIATTIFAIVAITGALPTPKPRLALVAMMRRTGGCSFSSTLDSFHHGKDLVAVRDKIAAGSKIIQNDAAFNLVDTPSGRWWIEGKDNGLTFILSEQEHEIYGTGSDGVQQGDVVLDCGANIGVFTRTALNRGARLVVGIEPSPTALECYRRNFAADIQSGRVIVCPKGVWNKEGSLKLYGDSLVEKRTAEGVTVPLTTIDKLAAELNLPRVDFIKMDIEGAEKQALEGGAATIRRYRPRLAISSEHLPDDATAIPRAISAIQPGYRIQSTDCLDFLTQVKPAVLLCSFPSH